MKNEARKIELSGKILQMGKSLIQEGQKIEDYTITQSGSIMLLVSSLLLSDEDMFMFSEICSMFSAKKILDASEGIDDSNIVNKIMKSKEKKPIKRRKRKDDGEDINN